MRFPIKEGEDDYDNYEDKKDSLLVSQGYTQPKKRVGIALIILIIALILFSGYFLFFYSKPVSTIEEFVEATNHCNDVSWVREDAQAAWLYIVKGSEKGDACKIEVRLLQMKEGTIEAEKLQGKKMICDVKKGEERFPEKDISRCTGELKEELQDIIIQRMHNYLLQNVGEIKEEFESL
jgi:hypothetical protein